MEFERADDVYQIIIKLINNFKFYHIDIRQIFCVRSYGSKARAYARIWGLPRIFQFSCGFKPSYIIEVLSKHYDKLSFEEKTKTLIHELLHIPKTFSGALLSHRGRFRRINKKEVEKLYKKFKILC